MTEHEHDWHDWTYIGPQTNGRLWRCKCGAEVVRCFNCGVSVDGPPRGPCAGHGTAHATYD